MNNKETKMKNPKCTCKPCTCEPVCTCGLDEYEKTTIEDLALELESARAAATENLNLAKYQKAEFENYKKRNAQLVENSFSDGKVFAVMSILPVLDSYGEALRLVTNLADKQGFDMLRRKFEAQLATLGVEEITTTVGEKFSYDFHNAIAAEKVEGKESGTIAQVWQKGYKMNGKVIRPASVTVVE